MDSASGDTVGGAVDDPRLTTLPAYGARVKARQRGVELLDPESTKT